MGEPAELEVMVETDGTVRVSADATASCGFRPGDHLKLVQSPRRSRRSMIGAAERPSGFTDEHLADLRREMGKGLGDDLTR